MTDVCAEALDLIKRNEGCRLIAYRDVVGIWTIGYGHTPAHAGQRITQAEADALFKADIDKFADGVDALVSDDTGDNQFGAMVSLAYNIGLHAFKGSSVLRHHNRGEFQAAADAFRMWNKAGGQVVKGLARRREEERELYMKDGV